MWRRFFVVFASFAACALAQDNPGWWSNTIRSGDSHALEDNYAPTNLGQLKNFADQARLHLNGNLDGGSGTAIETMVAGWTGSLDGNYSPINLGQLKFVADKFYSRLDEVGFDYKTQLQSNGYSGVWTSVSGGHERPWNESAAPETNYTPANLGQLKILFSFDLSNYDTDDDGLSDGWEQSHFGTLTHDSTTDTDGDGISDVDEIGLNLNWNEANVTLTKVSGDAQTGSPNGFVSQPLVVSVINVIGNSVTNFPVTFNITSGGGTLQKSYASTVGSSAQSLSDFDGQAKAFFKLPNSASTTSQITVVAGAQQVVFSESSDSGSGTYGSPFAPSNVTSVLNSDGSVDMTWENNTDNPAGIPISYRKEDGTWQTVFTVPAGSTSAHIPPQ